jgi:hypothetical protein
MLGYFSSIQENPLARKYKTVSGWKKAGFQFSFPACLLVLFPFEGFSSPAGRFGSPA